MTEETYGPVFKEKEFNDAIEKLQRIFSLGKTPKQLDRLMFSLVVSTSHEKNPEEMLGLQYAINQYGQIAIKDEKPEMAFVAARNEKQISPAVAVSAMAKALPIADLFLEQDYSLKCDSFQAHKVVQWYKENSSTWQDIPNRSIEDKKITGFWNEKLKSYLKEDNYRPFSKLVEDIIEINFPSPEEVEKLNEMLKSTDLRNSSIWTNRL